MVNIRDEKTKFQKSPSPWHIEPWDKFMIIAYPSKNDKTNQQGVQRMTETEWLAGLDLNGKWLNNKLTLRPYWRVSFGINKVIGRGWCQYTQKGEAAEMREYWTASL